MIKVEKEYNIDGTIIKLINGKNIVSLSMGGNLDLYITPLSNEDIISYDISTKDPIIYDIFNKLYVSIVNNYKDINIVKDNTICYYSDEDMEENANILKIYKTKDLKIRLEFIKVNNDVLYKANGIRIRNSRSRYSSCNLLFMDLYNSLCNFDFNYRNIDFEKVIIGTTCYHSNCGNIVSITGDGGNAWGFYGNAYKRLAPSYKLWQYYSTNPDSLEYEELLNYYILDFYKHRIEELDFKQLFATLYEKYGNDIILACHELPSMDISMESFCHRRLLADYIELEYGFKIPELSLIDNSVMEIPIYDLKPKIKELIKK